MSKFNDCFVNKIFLVYGFGKTGSAAYNYLKNKNKVFIYDDYKKFITFNKLKSIHFDYIVLSPGINVNNCKLTNYLKLNKKKIITDLDIFYLNNPKNLKITITGTNGKSTTAKLLYEVLKDQKKNVVLSGNIGIPILSVQNINYKTIFVIEASSYQIDYSQYYKSDYSFILNISPDHLERHGTMKKYVHSKFKLILNQNENYCSFIDNNKYLNNEIKKYKIKTKIVKIKNNFNYNIKKITNKYFYNYNNLKNLFFIFEFAKIFKLNKKVIFKTINSFKGLDFRQQIIYQNSHLTIINDSKSTSFSSSVNLLKSQNKIYWIVGGIAKKGDKFILGSNYYKNIKCFIFGKNKKFFNEKLKNKIYCYYNRSLEIILKKILLEINLKENIHHHILFSPAAASFDKFKNFEERGRYFNFLIKKTNFIKRANARFK